MITDLHVHTSEVSACSEICGEDVVKNYKDSPFDGIVITNHINGAYFGEKMSSGDWKKKIDWYVDGYKRAADVGEKIGLAVLFGCELCIASTGSDFLLYGVTEDFLKEYTNLNMMSLPEVSTACRDGGVLLFQAHPFRNGMKISKPSLIDGVEVLNGHAGHDSRNDFAKLWAERFGLLMCAGSDYHHPGGHARAGISTEFPIEDEKALVSVLKSGNFTIYDNTKQ